MHAYLVVVTCNMFDTGTPGEEAAQAPDEAADSVPATVPEGDISMLAEDAAPGLDASEAASSHPPPLEVLTRIYIRSHTSAHTCK